MFVEQDVGAFDVAVDDVVRVEVAQPPGGAKCNVGAHSPGQWQSSVFTPKSEKHTLSLRTLLIRTRNLRHFELKLNLSVN